MQYTVHLIDPDEERVGEGTSFSDLNAARQNIAYAWLSQYNDTPSRFIHSDMRELYESPSFETEAIVEYLRTHSDILPHPNQNSDLYWQVSFL